MTTDQDSDYCEISCDFCDEYVSERNFHDAKDVIDSTGWKTFKVGEEWNHKCGHCVQHDNDDESESLMDRYDP